MIREGGATKAVGRVRTKRYEQAGISRERYRELVYAARQYAELKTLEKKWRAGEIDRRNRGCTFWRRADPTGNEAARLAQSPYAWKIAAIEQAAVTAAPDICEYILRSVTRGERFEEMNVPCHRNTFFAARRRFFVELDARLP